MEYKTPPEYQVPISVWVTVVGSLAAGQLDNALRIFKSIQLGAEKDQLSILPLIELSSYALLALDPEIKPLGPEIDNEFGDFLRDKVGIPCNPNSVYSTFLFFMGGNTTAPIEAGLGIDGALYMSFAALACLARRDPRPTPVVEFVTEALKLKYETDMHESDPSLATWREVFIDPTQTYDLPLEFVSVESLTKLLESTRDKLEGFGVVLHPASSSCADPACRGQSSAQVKALQEEGVRYAYPFNIEGSVLLDVTNTVLEKLRNLVLSFSSSVKTLSIGWEDLGITPKYDLDSISITVDSVSPFSAAEKAGIEEGMVLLSFNTTKIKGPIELKFSVEKNPDTEPSNSNLKMICEAPTVHPNIFGLCKDALVLRVQDTIKLILEELVKPATPIGPVPDVEVVDETSDAPPTPVFDTVSYIQLKSLGFNTLQEFTKMQFSESYSRDLPFSIYKGDIGNRSSFINAELLPIRAVPASLYHFGGYQSFKNPESVEHLTPALVQPALFPDLCAERVVKISREFILPCGDTSTCTLTGILDEYSNSFPSKGYAVKDGEHLMTAGVALYSPESFTTIGETPDNSLTGITFIPQGWEKLATMLPLKVRDSQLLVNKISRNMYWRVDGYVIVGCENPLHEEENERDWIYHSIVTTVYFPDSGKEPKEDSIIYVRAIPLVELSHMR